MSAQRERTRMMREPNFATIYSAALHIPVNGLDSQNAILIFILNCLLFFDQEWPFKGSTTDWLIVNDFRKSLKSNLSKFKISFFILMRKKKIPSFAIFIGECWTGKTRTV